MQAVKKCDIRIFLVGYHVDNGGKARAELAIKTAKDDTQILP